MATRSTNRYLNRDLDPKVYHFVESTHLALRLDLYTLSQTAQVYRFWPEWTIRCWFKLYVRVKTLEQNGQNFSLGTFSRRSVVELQIDHNELKNPSKKRTNESNFGRPYFFSVVLTKVFNLFSASTCFCKCRLQKNVCFVVINYFAFYIGLNTNPKTDFVMNSSLQMSHVKFFLPVWISRCCFRLNFRLNTFPHRSQSNVGPENSFSQFLFGERQNEGLS